MRKPALAAIVLSLLLFSAADVAHAQLAESAQKFVQVANSYQVTPNITYLTANNWDAKLDIYQPRGSDRAESDAGLFSWRGLDGRKQGNFFAHVPAVPRDGLDGGQRGISTGIGLAGAGGG